MSKALAAKGERILLHVYEPAKSEGGSSWLGFGVYHTGIELCDNGIEWCYAGAPNAPGSGIQQQRAKQSPDENQWKYKETIELGRTTKSSAQCAALIREMESEYSARDYDLIHHNCNHFTADVSERLGLKYPSHINRAAKLGSLFLDNPIKDRQRKEAERKAEEERKKNVFANTAGHSLVSAAADGKKSSAAISTASGSPVHGNSAAAATKAVDAAKANLGSGSAAVAGSRRPNPWADPNFFPGGKKPAASSATTAGGKK